MLKGCLCKFLFLLLSPAQVSSPKRETVGNQNIEHADIQGKPPVECDSLRGAPFTLEEDELAPGHQASQDEVEDSHKATDLSQEAPHVDIMHKKDDKDAQLYSEADDHAISELIVSIALTWFNAYNEHTYATSN